MGQKGNSMRTNPGHCRYAILEHGNMGKKKDRICHSAANRTFGRTGGMAVTNTFARVTPRWGKKEFSSKGSDSDSRSLAKGWLSAPDDTHT
jgi:hypothetical protein